jgi:hypothetical protein
MTTEETHEDDEHAGLFDSEGDEHGPDEDDDGS